VSKKQSEAMRVYHARKKEMDAMRQQVQNLKVKLEQERIASGRTIMLERETHTKQIHDLQRKHETIIKNAAPETILVTVVFANRTQTYKLPGG
jgi:divalent metal cation (Fe/Co/Zn/Cd) transporter